MQRIQIFRGVGEDSANWRADWLTWKCYLGLLCDDLLSQTAVSTENNLQRIRAFDISVKLDVFLGFICSTKVKDASFAMSGDKLIL